MWFGQYATCIQTKMPEASALQGLTHNSIDSSIVAREQYRNYIRTQQPGSWAAYTQVNSATKISASDVHNLHLMCDVLTSYAGQYRLTNMGLDYLYIYTNNVELISTIKQLPYITNCKLTQISRVTGKPGTVRLKKSFYQYRSYFRTTRCTEQQLHSLSNFLNAQTNVSMCKSLIDRFNRNSPFIKEYYFFDHNDQQIPFMLNLIIPRIVSKTLTIVTDDK